MSNSAHGEGACLRATPWLARYCGLTLVVTLLLLYMGGFTTTIRAGMVFLDWPTSNGTFNPPGWLENEAMFAEHSHRLLGAAVGLLAIGLVVWVWRVERRGWLRWASVAVLGLICLQGLLGGLRVLEDSTAYAIAHGVLGQLILCLLLVTVMGTTRTWRRLRDPGEAVSTQVRPLGLVVFALIFVQLVVAAVMRHLEAGLAIPTFPASSESGAWLPGRWTAGVSVNFLHRVLAGVIYATLLAWGWRVLTCPAPTGLAKLLAWGLLISVHGQVALGAFSVWTEREKLITTLHMFNGALLLAGSCLLVFLYARALVERPTRREIVMREPAFASVG